MNTLTRRLGQPGVEREVLCHSRRDFFSRIGDGISGAALAHLLGSDLLAAAPGPENTPTRSDLQPRSPHFEAPAKSVILLFMSGGPSQVDLFDPKPMLEKHAGQLPGRELVNDVLFTEEAGGLMPSPFQFARHGQSGIQLSELMPHLARSVDELAVIRSMYTTSFTHGPGIFMMHGGTVFPGRPTMGAWVTYGLGSENQNLPAYVVLADPEGPPTAGIKNWQPGWLPPVFQGTPLRSKGSPMLNLHPREPYPPTVRTLARGLLKRLAEDHRQERTGQPELDARISSYELAARMQISAADVLDLSQESERTRTLYGLDKELTASYGRRCLMARRLVERGVRFVQIHIKGQIWDNHSNVVTGLGKACGQTDQPVGALLTDLKQRGLLETTLVLWGGEFGRLPLSQRGLGRDHGPAGFSVWMAGGGVKGGTVYGGTDEIGYKAVENRTSVHDFHATMLHLLGLDHKKLVYKHNGLDERLTGQEAARVVKEILA